MRSDLAVLKFGGSVLRGEADLALGVREVVRWTGAGKRVIAVVSAFEGTTDKLLGDARRVLGPKAAGADAAALAMLLATGEFTTAALLGLTLACEGVSARVLGPGAVSLRTLGGGADADPVAVDHAAVWTALRDAEVAVVPGFVALDPASNLALLGRGGSDLTALFLAAELGAARCRLIKDVDGVYDRDPNAAPVGVARRYRELHWDEALTLDGGIVQHKAVRLARSRGVGFEVAAWGRDDVTLVGAGPSRLYGQEVRRDSGVAVGA